MSTRCDPKTGRETHCNRELLQVCQRILGQHLVTNVTTHRPEQQLDETDLHQIALTKNCVREQLSELCHEHGVQARRVRIAAGSWQRNHGSILALHKGRPVALLPRFLGGYWVVWGDGRRRRLRPELAEGLDLDATYVLYAPLPSPSPSLPQLLVRASKDRRSELLLTFLVSVAIGLLALALPLATEALADLVLADSSGEQQRWSQPWLLAVAVLCASAAGALFHLLRGLAVVRLKAGMNLSLQAALWSHILALPAAFFRRFTVGDLGNRALGIQRIHSLLGGEVTGAVLALLSATLSWAILLRYSPLLAWTAAALIGLHGAVAANLALRKVKHQRRSEAADGELAGLLHSLLVGITKLRAAGAEQRAFGRWARPFAQKLQAARASKALGNAMAVFGAVFAPGAALLLFAIMAATLVRGEATVGELLAVHAAYGQLQAAALVVLGVLPSLVGLVPAWERLQPILEANPERCAPQLEGGAAKHDPGPLAGSLALEKVSFRYRQEGPPVLDGVSLQAAPGEMVALVGPSGSGKSTCLRLLLGFEQPEQGRVLYDHQDLRQLNRDRLRRQLGVVLQHGQPMVGTIFQNIVGAHGLGIDEAWWAAEQVGLAEEIRSMPMGMFTLINPRARSFSGGQRQRLLLARALLGQPRVLLLDEATSNLDNRTQERVVRNLARLRVTRLVIAHRLSTVRHADHIVVLQQGRVVERGNYQQLYRRGGLFAHMAQRQIA